MFGGYQVSLEFVSFVACRVVLGRSAERELNFVEWELMCCGKGKGLELMCCNTERELDFVEWELMCCGKGRELDFVELELCL